jgi:putative endonuclease
MARQPVVYILASPNGRALHIGVTTDLGRRLEEHWRGMSIHTAQYNITRLVDVESHETAPKACSGETLPRRKAARELVKSDLAIPD